MVNMLHKMTSVSSETALMKLTFKQKKFIYEIARLEYRIFNALTKLGKVNLLIEEEEKNIKALNAAIYAAGEGNVAEKLISWKVKAEYKLFKLHLRKGKIDPVKLVINQSILDQTKHALLALEADINRLKKPNPPTEKPIINTYVHLSSLLNTQYPPSNAMLKSIDEYIRGILKMAS